MPSVAKVNFFKGRIPKAKRLEIYKRAQEVAGFKRTSTGLQLGDFTLTLLGPSCVAAGTNAFLDKNLACIGVTGVGFVIREICLDNHKLAIKKAAEIAEKLKKNGFFAKRKIVRCEKIYCR